MRFNLILVGLLLLLFLPLVFAQQGFENGVDFPSGVNSSLGVQSGGFGGAELGQQVGSSLAQSAASGLEGTLASVMEIFQMILRIVLFGIAAFAVVVVIWLILLLIVLRNIMKRDDLKSGERVAWVIIVFFFGFLPLSPFGMLLYALSGGSKKKVADAAKK